MTDHYIHKEYPKTCDPKDFLGQVKRTVNSQPVTQRQIDLIIDSVNHFLKLSENDILLDIGCGNGFLSNYFFDKCSEFLGVDFSDYLIEIAKLNFEKAPTHVFQNDDAASYVDSEKNPNRFTKALCYGCFAYLSFEDAKEVLIKLRKRFNNIKVLYIGNLPDKDLAHKFYNKTTNNFPDLSDNKSSIGIWRSKQEMIDLANETGWKIEIITMPEEFYASHYRYDAILRPL